MHIPFRGYSTLLLTGDLGIEFRYEKPMECVTPLVMKFI